MTALVSTAIALRPARLGMADSLGLRHEPRFAAAGFLMLGLILPTLFAMAVEDRTLEGVNLWLKPLKFEVSLALYLFTLAIFARFAPPALLASRAYRIFSATVVAMIALEMIWIGTAAALGVKSHFNESSALWALAYSFMGLAATILTSATLVLGVAVLAHRASGLSPAMRAAIGQGLIATFVLTLVAAFTMASGTGHFVGVSAAEAETLAVMGWARNGGDLRVPHFFATHAMHFIPAFGLLSAAWFGRERTWPVSVFTVAFTVFTLLVLVQALSGRPFLAGLG